jgi:hypothetical protein
MTRQETHEVVAKAKGSFQCLSVSMKKGHSLPYWIERTRPQQSPPTEHERAFLDFRLV